MSLRTDDATRPHRAWHVLENRDFRLLWAGEGTSAFGTSVSRFALPLMTLTQLHRGVVWVGVLTAVEWMPWLFCSLPAGAWIDRLSRRRTMMICDLASMCLLASIPAAALLGVLSLAQVLAVAALVGVSDVFLMNAFRAYAPSLLANDQLVDGTSLLHTMRCIADLTGPAAAGLLAGLAGASTSVVVDVVSYLVSLGCLARIETTELRPNSLRASLKADIREGLAFVMGDRLLRYFVTYGGAANMLWAGFAAIDLAFLLHTVRLTPGAAGVLASLGGIGGVVGAGTAPTLARRFGGARTLMATMLATAPLVLLIPLAAPGWRAILFSVGIAGATGAISIGSVVRAGFYPAYCPPELLGRVTSTMQLMNFGAIPVGALMGGQLALALGPRVAVSVLMIGLATVSTSSLASPVRGRRDLPETTAPALVGGSEGPT